MIFQIYWFDVFFAWIFVLFILHILKKGDFAISKNEMKYFGPLLVFLFFLLLAFFVGTITNSLRASIRDIRFLPYYLLIFPFVYFINNEKKMQTLFNVMLTGCVISFLGNIAGSVLSIRFLSMIGTIAAVQKYMAFGFAEIKLSPFNSYLIGIPIIFNRFIMRYDKKKLSMLILLGISLLSLFTFFSKAQMIAVFISIIMTYYFEWNIISPKTKRRSFLFLIFGFIIISSAGLFETIFNISDLFDTKNISNLYRIKEYQVAFASIHGLNILWGNGFGYRFSFYLVGKLISNTFMHNYYIYLLAKAGIIALLSFIYLNKKILMSIKHFKNSYYVSKKRFFISTSVLSIYAVLISGFFTTNMYFGAHIILPILFGIVIVCTRLENFPAAKSRVSI
ncbi:MAG: hypothetical protein CMB97_00510 [Flavobacteriaceae bacterium]|nr:hypothetical protein [Flavobacteriaceae bacterium]